jgi:adenylate cyclase
MITRTFKRLFRFSIATKLIIAALLLVLAAAIPLVHESIRYFETMSQKKESDINLNHAVARATEVENILQGLLEKCRAIGSLYLMHRKSKSSDLLASIETLLDNDRDIFAVDLYQSKDGDLSLERTLIRKKQFQQLGADESLLERIRLKNPFPVSSVAQGQIEILPALSESEIPLMAFGLPISRNDLGQIDGISVVYFQLARLQRVFSKSSERENFLVDRRGFPLAHPDEQLFLSGKSFQAHPVVAAALNGSSPRGQLPFRHPKTQLDYRGAFAKTAMGPIVISEVGDDHILAPARESRRQSVLIAGLILSASLFLVFIFSLSFSRPIENLAGFIREVSNGNLDVTAQDKIHSQDEVGELAVAFDEMVGGLRERAKAYSVMRQALGSSVVETLMNMKSEELGGQRKPVSVLFSDLRDFTKFSEGHSPEEVVIMLNEYFDVMVKVIENHGGWLDKFIGDAIMAVWGVPYTGKKDEVKAVRAAIDMRLALQELNFARAARGQGPIKIGVGLHCGDAIVGKIGATERANLTVIGDTVNQASRIEASTKAFGTDILLSQEMAELVSDQILVELAGQAEVKGKTEALKLYKIRGFVDDNGNDVEIVTQWSEYAAEAADKVKVS